MKCLLIALVLCSSLYLCSSLSTVRPTTPDYREKYDKLWLEIINEKIREGERFLERESEKVIEYQKTHNEQERVRLAAEVEVLIANTKVYILSLQKDLKNPNLNLIERFSFEKVIAEGEVVTKLLVELQKIVAKKF